MYVNFKNMVDKTKVPFPEGFLPYLMLALLIPSARGQTHSIEDTSAASWKTTTTTQLASNASSSYKHSTVQSAPHSMTSQIPLTSSMAPTSASTAATFHSTTHFLTSTTQPFPEKSDSTSQQSTVSTEMQTAFPFTHSSSFLTSQQTQASSRPNKTSSVTQTLVTTIDHDHLTTNVSQTTTELMPTTNADINTTKQVKQTSVTETILVITTGVHQNSSDIVDSNIEPTSSDIATAMSDSEIENVIAGIVAALVLVVCLVLTIFVVRKRLLRRKLRSTPGKDKTPDSKQFVDIEIDIGEDGGMTTMAARGSLSNHVDFSADTHSDHHDNRVFDMTTDLDEPDVTFKAPHSSSFIHVDSNGDI